MHPGKSLILRHVAPQPYNQCITHASICIGKVMQPWSREGDIALSTGKPPRGKEVAGLVMGARCSKQGHCSNVTPTLIAPQCTLTCTRGARNEETRGVTGTESACCVQHTLQAISPDSKRANSSRHLPQRGTHCHTGPSS